MDWNALLISMELKAETDESLTPILMRHWDLFPELFLQPEQAQQPRLTRKWAKLPACVSWDWLYRNSQIPSRNQARIICKWCKQASTISLSITAKAITPMGRFAEGLYRTWIKLDNGFLNQPLPRDLVEERQSHKIRQAFSFSLPIQTRDANVGIIHTRSVYSEQVPRILPGPRDRRMTAGGTIEWEISGFFPAPNTPHTNQQSDMSEPSPEPTPDSEAPPRDLRKSPFHLLR